MACVIFLFQPEGEATVWCGPPGAPDPVRVGCHSLLGEHWDGRPEDTLAQALCRTGKESLQN